MNSQVFYPISHFNVFEIFIASLRFPSGYRNQVDYWVSFCRLCLPKNECNCINCKTLSDILWMLLICKIIKHRSHRTRKSKTKHKSSLKITSGGSQLITKVFAPKSFGFVLFPIGLPACITGITREVFGNGVAPSYIARNVVFRNGVARRQKCDIVTSFNEYAKKILLKYLKTMFSVPVKLTLSPQQKKNISSDANH